MDVEIAPLRTLNDFGLEGARFQVPTISDSQRWSNRVLNNLLYYQTNYLCLSIFAFLAVGFMHPVQMLSGILLVLVIVVAWIQTTNNRQDMRRFQQEHPLVSLLIVIAIMYFIGKLFGSLLVFAFGLLLPFALTLVHASLRMRNASNKFSRFKEYVGLKRTPMGLLLEGLGQEQEAGS